MYSLLCTYIIAEINFIVFLKFYSYFKGSDPLNVSLNRQTRIYEKQILEAIEKLRQQLQEEGYPDLGIPPLDPLNIENKQFLLNIDNLLK